MERNSGIQVVGKVPQLEICFISKYPPIEGGVSSSTYWLARRLGEKEHEIHVITNAFEVESEFREKFNLADPNFSPKNVKVHSTDPSPTIEANPSHIPFSKMYCEKLASLAIEVIEENDIQVIDSWYLIPYCVSGYLAKSFANIPQIIRHAGSDLQRLYPSPYLKGLLKKVIENADRIITTPAQMNFFHNLGIPPSKITLMQKIPVDMQAFNPKISPLDLSPHISNKKYFSGIPIIAYIGKITHNFKTKGLCELLEACSRIDEEFLLLFVSNGKKLTEFKKLVENKKLMEKTAFLDFVPPWQLPSVLKACMCIVALEKEISPTLKHHIPATPAEAIATGRCVLMSSGLHAKEPYKHFKDGKAVFVVRPDNVEKIKEILEKLIRNPDIPNTVGANGHRVITKYDQFDEYVDKTIRLYKSLSLFNCAKS